MMRRYITAYGVSPLHRIEDSVNQYTYKNILEKNLLETIKNMLVSEFAVIFLIVSNKFLCEEREKLAAGHFKS